MITGMATACRFPIRITSKGRTQARFNLFHDETRNASGSPAAKPEGHASAIRELHEAMAEAEDLLAGVRTRGV